jgi:hypothetical protein
MDSFQLVEYYKAKIENLKQQLNVPGLSEARELAIRQQMNTLFSKLPALPTLPVTQQQQQQQQQIFSAPADFGNTNNADVTAMFQQILTMLREQKRDSSSQTEISSAVQDWVNRLELPSSQQRAAATALTQNQDDDDDATSTEQSSSSNNGFALLTNAVKTFFLGPFVKNEQGIPQVKATDGTHARIFVQRCLSPLSSKFSQFQVETEWLVNTTDSEENIQSLKLRVSISVELRDNNKRNGLDELDEAMRQIAVDLKAEELLRTSPTKWMILTEEDMIAQTNEK